MSSGPVRIYNFARYGDRYLLQHSSGKLTRVPGRFDGWNLWKEVVFILLNRSQDRPVDATEKLDNWEFEETNNDGNLKKFWFSRNVLAYTHEGIAYMRIGQKLERITSADAVKQYWFGPFCFYSIKCGRIRSFALGTEWFDFISRLIDPTYDGIDSMAADFAGYVNRIFERATP